MPRYDVHRLLSALQIQTKRSGALLWASCPSPDHADSDPSWRMIANPESPKYGQHRCYGCGFGGYPVHLVASVLDLELPDARAWLADYGGSALPDEVVVQSAAPPLPGDFRLPDGVVTAEEKDPRSWPSRARSYLIERGVTLEQALKWNLGYSATGRLYGRIVFPVHDADGRLVSYTGRTFIGAEKRYKEPLLSEGADQSAIFGEEWWQGNCVVVAEGAFDALACERALPEWDIAAIFGSQVSSGHLLKLSRFRLVLLASDPDKAGDAAALELGGALARHAKVARVKFPPGLDCNDLDLMGKLRPLLLETLRSNGML